MNSNKDHEKWTSREYTLHSHTNIREAANLSDPSYLKVHYTYLFWTQLSPHRASETHKGREWVQLCQAEQAPEVAIVECTTFPCVLRSITDAMLLQ